MLSPVLRLIALVLLGVRAAAVSRTLQLFLIGGVIFSALSFWSYSAIDGNLYQVRDDGVITMSHARNWVDYGFIGVNPSGGRVEGYSAPVQFLVYAIAYRLSGLSYDTYAAAQTVIATFLLGGLFILFFRDHRVYAVILTGLAALLLFNLMPFLQWHGSGMENAITHTLFLAAVLILVSFAKSGKITYPLALIVFLATISRIDSVYHIAPLLLIFSLFWWFTFKNPGGLYFSLVVFGLWSVFHLWRYLYFGDLLPNTAYAQGITAGPGWYDLLRPAPDVIEIARKIFARHGAYLLLLASPFLFFARRKRGALLLFLLIGSIGLTAWFNPAVFGEATLDAARTTTHLALFTALGVAAIFYQIDNRRHLLWIGPTLLTAGFFVFQLNSVPPRDLCCDINRFDSIRQEFARLARQEGLVRPTVANPDLGIMSWHKQFNIVDLGRLGSPIMAKLNTPAPLPWIMDEYFFEYAAPDLIESHDLWSCRYDQAIFSDPRFERNYQPIEVRVDELTKKHCRANPAALSGIWIRRDILQSSESRERKLIDALASSPSVAPLRRELAWCQAQPDHNCVYVARTAYRFLPELRGQGLIDELNELFGQSRTREYDLYLINGYRDGPAYREAIAFILRGMLAVEPPAIRATFDVYLRDNTLTYVKEACAPADTEAHFFLHLYPVAVADLPDDRRPHGFDHLDFDFDGNGWIFNGRCMATVALPDYAISEINTGQFVSTAGGFEHLWEGEIHLDQ